MGNVINLAAHRADRRTRSVPVTRAAAAPRSSATFYFDLSCPFTYLAAERVDRAFDDVTWVPVSVAELRAIRYPHGSAAHEMLRRTVAEQRAAALRLPLEWPERYPATARRAMRAAALAADLGRARPFVLAASRLAFCGGFDICEPEALTEAAAAAGVGLDACMEAAADPSYDERISLATRRVVAGGADQLPGLCFDRAHVWGEPHLSAVISGLYGTPAVSVP